MSTPLACALSRYTDSAKGPGPYETAVPGLTILRSEGVQPPMHVIFKPSLCIAAQGVKRSTFGDRTFEYHPGEALVVGVDMPALSRIVEASPESPFLGLVLELDSAMLRETLERLPEVAASCGGTAFGVHLGRFDGALEDCVVRLVRLLDEPEAVTAVAPLIMRELSFRLLSGPHGSDVARFVLASGFERRLLDAIHVLRDRFDKNVRVEELAGIAQMSPSAFHRQFKTLTSMSPVQYQKQLRLTRARELLLDGRFNAETAAYHVGYQSPSQFSREYARMFGVPPRRDAASAVPDLKTG